MALTAWQVNRLTVSAVWLVLNNETQVWLRCTCVFSFCSGAASRLIFCCLEDLAMTFFELFLIGIGLSMDAFAVSICKGLSMQKIDKTYTLCIGLFFGGFQALMPLAGYLLGSQFSGYIERYDHWIAFVLLALIGFSMIRESRGEDSEEEKPHAGVNLKELLLLAVATSIDALAVGVTFAFLNVSIAPAVTVIGCTTFVISIAGVCVGNVFGARYKSRAELTGGVILILIGLKILLEHLGVIAF